ncbi:single-stranded DNA-binding protein [Clostridium rectalis]|uniref:single-stranded DNA-binding protein n=1 Tax=Clostridium rectalis TaxID=2040295 RepID=UPI000F62CAAA|nr:single-stranded DNA-binding protein [Clostridium rectalis]
MNKCVITGRLTKDPELKFVPGSGKAVANFTLAVDRKFKQEGQQSADFIPVVVWGKQAESTANYMRKGSQLSVAGKIQTRNYESKDGTRIYVTEVVADEVQFLEWGNKQQSTTPQGYDSKYVSNTSGGFNNNSFDEDITPVDDEIPF